MLPTQWLAGLRLGEGESLWQDGLIDPSYPSTCASTASVWGSQNVISIAWYNARAVDSAVRACSR